MPINIHNKSTHIPSSDSVERSKVLSLLNLDAIPIIHTHTDPNLMLQIQSGVQIVSPFPSPPHMFNIITNFLSDPMETCQILKHIQHGQGRIQVVSTLIHI